MRLPGNRARQRRLRRTVPAPERCAPDPSRPSSVASQDRSVSGSQRCRRRIRCEPARNRRRETRPQCRRGRQTRRARRLGPREKPASTSRSANRCGSISVPGRSSTRRGADAPANSRAATAPTPTPRSIGRSRPPQRGCPGPRRRHAEVRRHASVWIDLNRGKRKHRLLNHGRRRPRARHRRTARRRSSARRPDRSGRRAVSGAPDDRAAWTAASALLAGVSPAVIGERPSGHDCCLAEQRAQRQRWRGRRHCSAPRTFSMRRVEENPSARATRNRAATGLDDIASRRCCRRPSLLPLTRTSG